VAETVEICGSGVFRAIEDAQLFGTAARYRRLSDSKTAFGDEGATRPPPMLLGY
jgi:hypothetical protein